MKCPCGNNADLTSTRSDYCKECNIWIDRQLEEYKQQEDKNNDLK